MLASSYGAHKDTEECLSTYNHSQEFPVVMVTGGIFGFAVVIILFACYILRGRK